MYEKYINDYVNTSVCCLNCENNHLLGDEEPCASCDTDLSNFKPKKKHCIDCTHHDKSASEEPCASCNDGKINFMPKSGLGNCLTCRHCFGSSMFKEPCKSCHSVEGEPNTNYEPADTEEIIKLDMVNHPAHYQGKNECIDVMEVMFGRGAVIDFCRCNAFKYRFRADKKNGEEDIQKAEWYETKLMDLLNKKEPERW